MTSLHLTSGTSSPSVGSSNQRKRNSSPNFFSVYTIDIAAAEADHDLPCWLVINNRGQVVARAHSELLAIAKMQLLLLRNLTSSANVPTVTSTS